MTQKSGKFVNDRFSAVLRSVSAVKIIGPVLFKETKSLRLRSVNSSTIIHRINILLEETVVASCWTMLPPAQHIPQWLP
jgi:hypothetical protein